MATDVTFTAVAPGDVVDAAWNMRAADAEECRAAGYRTTIEALAASLEVSELSFAAKDEAGRVLGIGGAVRTGTALAPCAYVWWLSTTWVRPRQLLQAGARVVREALQRYGSLTAAVDARYAAAVRWLRWLGFTLSAPVPVPPFGLPFHLARVVEGPWES